MKLQEFQLAIDTQLSFASSLLFAQFPFKSNLLFGGPEGSSRTPPVRLNISVSLLLLITGRRDRARFRSRDISDQCTLDGQLFTDNVVREGVHYLSNRAISCSCFNNDKLSPSSIEQDRRTIRPATASDNG